MKIQFCGTGAAEGVPAMFCDCATCRNAKKGRLERRNRSLLLINDELFIDFGPDVPGVCFENNINMEKLKYILVTHTHFDHFYPENLEIRSKRYLTKKPAEIRIIGSKNVAEKISTLGYSNRELCIDVVEIEPYEKVYVDDYEIIAIPANHEMNGEQALNYVINNNGVTLLYAVDTGVYTKEQFDRINNLVIDILILDGTNVFGYTSKNHLNLKGLKEMLNQFKSRNLLSESSIIFSSHFSHSSILSHNLMKKILKDYDIIPAYDGMFFFSDGDEI